MKELKYWQYLVKKCKPMKDNNYTARLIFQRTLKLNVSK